MGLQCAPDVQFFDKERIMAVEEARERIRSRIWQSIAASGVSVNAIPKDQLDTLVNAIADGVLVAVDQEFEEAGLPSRGLAQEAAPLGDEEKLLWEGRPFLSLATYYRITNQRVRAQYGVIGRDFDDIELIRIQDLDRSQGLTERMLGIGDIHIISADPSRPTLVLNNVADPDHVHEILRKAMLGARKKYRYSVQEEM
jgi:hypothetical protein